jgi:hypothetical protein
MRIGRMSAAGRILNAVLRLHGRVGGGDRHAGSDARFLRFVADGTGS